MGISRRHLRYQRFLIFTGRRSDLSIRLWNLGFETKLIPTAYVYHKRRIDWEKFALQVNKFGRLGLFSIVGIHSTINLLFSSLFFYFRIGLSRDAFGFTLDHLLKLYFIYFFILFLVSTFQNKSLKIGYLSVIAVWKQFWIWYWL
jgi:GT2 family glycosyltransferase